MSELEKSLLVPNRRALQPGEWACVDAKCAHVNAEKRNSCEVCSKGKPRAKSRVGREIGKDAAEKSKGLFSADDWVCTKCGNVNWARRSVCNICNAPKLGDLEMRTGYGGGYMDRQDVEYIERDDNDEEFDEFGRKKKKRNKDDKTNPDIVTDLPEAIPEVNVNDKEDINDEVIDEDSDDGDLDKYDLTADPELFSFKVEPIKVVTSLPDEDDRQSAICSDCSCSCSGGECSCVESEEESQPKKHKDDRDEDKKQSSDRSKSKSSTFHKDFRGDRRNGDRKRDEERSDRGSRSDRERYRSRERDHYRDHR